MPSVYRGNGAPTVTPDNLGCVRKRHAAVVRDAASECEQQLNLADFAATNFHDERVASRHRLRAQDAARRAWDAALTFAAIEARVVGQGFAGTCPGDSAPKTPATQERICHDVAASKDAGDDTVRATAYGREGIA